VNPTREQLEELRDTAISDEVYCLASMALGFTPEGAFAAPDNIVTARARCAEILNARSAK